MREQSARRGAWVAFAASLAMVVTMAIPPVAGASRPLAHGRSFSPEVNVWITTANQQMELAKQAPVAFSARPPSYETVTVDSTRSFQTLTGFGGSINESSAYNLYALPASQRDQVMHMLFAPKTGDGLDFLRQPIGSAMVAGGRDYTHDDIPAGQTDYLQQHFSIAQDQAEILPLLREAHAINPHLTIMAAPWSPPAWMKASGSLIGGRLIDDPRIYLSYALYLLKFLEAYRAAGVDVEYLSVQNEPQNRTPAGYPGSDMPSWQEERVIEDLGPMIRLAHLGTKILAYDHNWQEHPNDIASTPPDETADVKSYPQNVLNSAAARWVAGVAFHCYYGDPTAMTALHNQFPKKEILETECSGTQSADPAKTFPDALKWYARNLEIGSTRNWSKTVVNWSIALGPNGGPDLGGCATCTGILTIGPGDTVTPNAEYLPWAI
jgi:glucosylceramidase